MMNDIMLQEMNDKIKHLEEENAMFRRTLALVVSLIIEHFGNMISISINTIQYKFKKR